MSDRGDERMRNEKHIFPLTRKVGSTQLFFLPPPLTPLSLRRCSALSREKKGMLTFSINFACVGVIKLNFTFYRPRRTVFLGFVCRCTELTSVKLIN